jgi:hypothetical protein
MNIEAARQYYKESTSNRKMLEGIFTKEELEIESETFLKVKQCPSQEEFNKFFEEEILSKIDPTKTSFPDKNNFSHIELYNSNGDWLFDYDTDTDSKYPDTDLKDPHFWYEYTYVCSIFMDQFSLQDVDRHRLMKSLVASHFKIKDIQPITNVLQDINGLSLTSKKGE